MSLNTNEHNQSSISVTQCQRITWSVQEIANATGLSKNFLRYEIRRENLPVRKFGRRVLVLNKDLEFYLENGSKGAECLALEDSPEDDGDV